ncbi:hypothetical protein HJD18_08715 [Thermoleophilia bacterium SCSIO 60948]|nr:hypothetical protein HJD18_08715 [Thermoleophilia bacterium SCSIO 60948]
MKMPRIDKGPELKLPKFSKPKLRRGGGEKASNVAPAGGAPKPPKRGGPPISERVPAPVADLIRDLRDRRLLIPAIALIVALAAVPLLLARPDEDPVLPAAVPVAADADAVAPAVLVDSTGVRDYEKRLASLKSRNPFSAPVAVNLDAPTDGAVSEDVPVTDDGSSDLGTDTLPDGSFTDPGIVDPGTPVDPGAPVAPPDTGTDTDTDDGGSNNGGGNNGGNSGGNDKPEIRYITEQISYQVGVSVGEQGQPLTQRNDLDLFQVLPSDSSPAAAFIGTDESGKRAAFLVSSDVTRVSGEQSCFPSPDDCQWAFLDPQSTMNLTYQPEDEPVERVFELRVDQIKKVKERVKG